MNAFLLMVPLFFIRFGLLRILNKDALDRAAHFALLEGKEKIALIFYQVSNILIILYPLFLKTQINSNLFFIALLIYILGISIFVISIVDFAKPKQSGVNTNGIYKLSRNPMYIGYFMYFLGCILLTHSLLLFLFLFIFQMSTHWIILSEEKWCIDKFGNEYVNYMNKVRRYI